MLEKLARNKLLQLTHGAEHYAAVAYAGCEAFEMHHIIVIVTVVLFVAGIGSIIYEWLVRVA